MRIAPRLSASLLLALVASACVVQAPPAPTPADEQVVKAAIRPTGAPGKSGGLLPQPDTPPVGGLLPQPDTPPVGGLLPQPDTPPVVAAAEAARAQPGASAMPALAPADGGALAGAKAGIAPTIGVPQGMKPAAPEVISNNGGSLWPETGVSSPVPTPSLTPSPNQNLSMTPPPRL